jgi:hypothetical protein
MFAKTTDHERFTPDSRYLFFSEATDGMCAAGQACQPLIVALRPLNVVYSDRLPHEKSVILVIFLVTITA